VAQYRTAAVAAFGVPSVAKKAGNECPVLAPKADIRLVPSNIRVSFMPRIMRSKAMAQPWPPKI
jgi:hypothetical protein